MERNQFLEEAVAIGRLMLMARDGTASMALWSRLAALDRDVAETVLARDVTWRHGKTKLMCAGYVVDIDEHNYRKLATALARVVMREDGKAAAAPA